LYINNLYTILLTLPAADFRAVLEPKNAVGSGLAGEFGSRPLLVQDTLNIHFIIDITIFTHYVQAQALTSDAADDRETTRIRSCV
jgi:hypothetical protein